ncbi:MAG: tetratricopeptide repeat protein [Spirochaetales bacterium]|nr:tetratricopeptide repeat protein [Spirochaetales bacterium]
MFIVIFLLITLGIILGIVAFFVIKSIVSPKKVATLALYVKQGKTAAAIRIAKQLLTKEPRNTEARYLLGNAYVLEGKPELAIMEYKRVNQIGIFGHYCPEVEFREKCAVLYNEFGQTEEALKEYLMLITLQPAFPENYYNAGLLFEKRNKAEKALNYYRKTIELNPRHSYAHFRLGYILFRGKKTVEAKVELDMAVKLDPQNYEAMFYLGRLQKENHDYSGALVSLERAQKDPDLKAKALIERGICYLQMGQIDQATTELERAIKLAKDPAAMEALYGRYFLAMCYEKTRSIDKAIEQWEFIYSRKPAFRDVAEKLSQYQDLRTDDKMKDYMTATMEEFYGICESVSGLMNLNINNVTDIPNGCQIIATENDARWRNAKKMPKLLWFLRAPEIVNESTVRNMHEQMKNLTINRGILISSSNFSRKAHDFVESRPIDLINKDRLQEMMQKIKIEPAPVRNRPQ